MPRKNENEIIHSFSLKKGSTDWTILLNGKLKRKILRATSKLV